MKHRSPYTAEVRNRLDRFMEEHVDYPYATKEEKKQLMFETRLLEHQITQYLSNYRRRRLPKNNIKFKRSKYNIENNPKENWGIISSVISLLLSTMSTTINIITSNRQIMMLTVVCLLKQRSEQRQVE